MTTGCSSSCWSCRAASRLAVGSYLTRPLAADIARLGEVAERVAAGDFTARTGVVRSDEVGRTARAVDSMVVALDEAAAERTQSCRTPVRLLFTSIGHDLRTPLAAMRAAVESLQDGVAPDPDRYFGILGSANSTTSKDCSTNSSSTPGSSPGSSNRERTTVSIAELAHEAVEALSPVAHRMDVDVQLDSDGPGVVVASTTDMSRVLRNLLENAIRHSPPGEAVRVAVRTGRRSRSASATRVPASPTTSATTPSSRSPAPTRHATSAPDTPGSAWPSPERSSKPTVGASGSRRSCGRRRAASRFPERNAA